MTCLKFISCFFCFIFSCIAIAQNEEVELWKAQIPNEIENESYKEIKVYEDSVLVKIKQVKIPTLTIYHPKKPNGTAVIICPGGGYQHLSVRKEGYKVAEWLNTLGITAFVLKYRLPSDCIMKDKTIGPLQDAQEAIRYVRRNASKLGINENKIGVLGFSAGGHLSATLSTRFDDDIYQHDEISAKPNFSILIYPVISMEASIAHYNSKTNLLGKSPSQELIDSYSLEKQVHSQMSPIFLVHAADDQSVSDKNSIYYYLALKEYAVPVEIHIYHQGGHGFGLGNGKTNQYWPNHCADWLKANEF